MMEESTERLLSQIAKDQVAFATEMAKQNQALKAQVEQLQQSLLKCAELVNVDGSTAIDWLIDNHHDLLQQAKAGE